MDKMKKTTFLTIPQEAKLGLYSLYMLRRMLAEGRLPGYFSGSRFYIHHEMLLEQIDRECRSRMGDTIPPDTASGDGGRVIFK